MAEHEHEHEHALTFRTAEAFSRSWSVRSHQLSTHSVQAFATSETLAALLKEPILSSTPVRRLDGGSLRGASWAEACEASASRELNVLAPCREISRCLCLATDSSGSFAQAPRKAEMTRKPYDDQLYSTADDSTVAAEQDSNVMQMNQHFPGKCKAGQL